MNQEKKVTKKQTRKTPFVIKSVLWLKMMYIYIPGVWERKNTEQFSPDDRILYVSK